MLIGRHPAEHAAIDLTGNETATPSLAIPVEDWLGQDGNDP